jgi:hypothetical protein
VRPLHQEDGWGWGARVHANPHRKGHKGKGDPGLR